MKPNHIEVDGKRYTGPEYAKAVGVVPWSVAYMRLKRDWSVRDAFHVPLAGRLYDKPLDRVAVLRAMVEKHQSLAVWHSDRAILHQRKLEAELARADRAAKRYETQHGIEPI